MADTEVLIIGGGIAGASAAWHLASQGRSVTLLERDDIASEASGVNAGGIGALGWGNIPDLQAYLTMGSLQIFKGLQLDLGYDIEFRASGALQAIETREQYDHIRDRVLELKAHGYTLDLLTNNEARGLEPELSPDLHGAVHFPLRAQADPVKATRALAEAAAQQRAQVLTGRNVTDIIRQDNGAYRVSCEKEELRDGGACDGAIGPGCGGVVSSPGEDAGPEHTHRAGPGPDVGFRAPAAEGVPLPVRCGVRLLLGS